MSPFVADSNPALTWYGLLNVSNFEIHAYFQVRREESSLHNEDKIKKEWNYATEPWVDFVRTGKDYYRDGLNNPATFKLIGDVKSLVVLDLACGEGYNTRMLARKGARALIFCFQKISPPSLYFPVTYSKPTSASAHASFMFVATFTVNSSSVGVSKRAFHNGCISLCSGCFCVQGSAVHTGDRGCGDIPLYPSNVGML